MPILEASDSAKKAYKAVPKFSSAFSLPSTMLSAARPFRAAVARAGPHGVCKDQSFMILADGFLGRTAVHVRAVHEPKSQRYVQLKKSSSERY